MTQDMSEAGTPMPAIATLVDGIGGRHDHSAATELARVANRRPARST